MERGSVLLAFLLGAVSGAAVALLYAPATGRETREYLGERAREGRERAAEAAAKGREVFNAGARDAGHRDRARTRSLSAGAGAGERVSDWAEVFLGVIAVATLATVDRCRSACWSPPAAWRGASAARRQVEQELRPMFGHLNAIGRDASRAAALATAQVERADQLFTDVSQEDSRTR